MRKTLRTSISAANEIERLISRHEETIQLFRARAKDPRYSNRGDLLQIAKFLEQKCETLREHAHRFGPTDRAELIYTAKEWLSAALRHLAKIETNVSNYSEAKTEAV